MSNRFSAGILPPQRHRPKAEHATERASSASAQRGAHSLYVLTESPLSQELPILGRTDFRYAILVIRLEGRSGFALRGQRHWLVKFFWRYVYR